MRRAAILAALRLPGCGTPAAVEGPVTLGQMA